MSPGTAGTHQSLVSREGRYTPVPCLQGRQVHTSTLSPWTSGTTPHVSSYTPVPCFQTRQVQHTSPLSQKMASTLSVPSLQGRQVLTSHLSPGTTATYQFFVSRDGRYNNSPSSPRTTVTHQSIFTTDCRYTPLPSKCICSYIFRWEFCGPFMSTCKRLLSVLISADPNIKRIVAHRKKVAKQLASNFSLRLVQKKGIAELRTELPTEKEVGHIILFMCLRCWNEGRYFQMQSISITKILKLPRTSFTHVAWFALGISRLV